MINNPQAVNFQRITMTHIVRGARAPIDELQSYILVELDIVIQVTT